MVHGSCEVWGRSRRRRPPRRPPVVVYGPCGVYPPPTYIPPVWLYNGVVVEPAHCHIPGTECVVYQVIHGHCSTTTIIVLYDPGRNVLFRMPYDAFKMSWRRSSVRPWGVSKLMQVRSWSPEEVEDGRW